MDHSGKRQNIIERLWKMKAGDGYTIPLIDFHDCFRGNWLTGRPAIDELLEMLPGSNWGEYTAEFRQNGVDVRRHKGSGKRVREDWDRR